MPGGSPVARPDQPRVASPADAGTVAELLDRFNRELDTTTPGPAVLAGRPERLLAGDAVLAMLSGSPSNTEPGEEESMLYYFREPP